MRLCAPPFPKILNTAIYFYVQAGHRQTAIETAIGVIREADKREQRELEGDPYLLELTGQMGEWVIESLLQGAWMREYHEWEKATKAFFDGNHVRNGNVNVDWRARLVGVSGPSHLDRVRSQLALFNASVPTNVLDDIDDARVRVNSAKHEAEYSISEDDFQKLMHAELAFWEALTEQEE